MDNQIIKYKDLFKKLGFDESFISGFIDTVVIDFQYSSHKNLRKKAHHTRNFLLNVFLIFIYLLISNFVYFFFKLIFVVNFMCFSNRAEIKVVSIVEPAESSMYQNFMN